MPTKNNRVHSSYSHVYFIGIGGIGMSAIARYYLNQGVEVGGYDRTATPLTYQLQQLGAHIIYHDEAHLLDSFLNAPRANTLVIYTPAVPQNSAILNYFQNKQYNIVKRSKALGAITQGGNIIAVAGTHGKTTTSTLIAHIFTSAKIEINAFLGGIATNYNTNYLLGQSDIFIVEADEYDRSFLTLFPSIAVITATDADHLDIYGTAQNMIHAFEDFASQIANNGTLILNTSAKLKRLPVQAQVISYGEYGESYAHNLRVHGNRFIFDFVGKGVSIHDIICGLPGIHNVENAVAAINVALKFKIDPQVIKTAIESFKGVKRRFETWYNQDDLVIIDDYAHHPQEITMLVKSVRQLYPQYSITGIFQPHLYSRTAHFANEFAQALSLLDEVMLLEIYPAREIPIEGVDSSMLLGKITTSKKHLSSTKELISDLNKISISKPQVILTIGASDIDKFIPQIIEHFKNEETQFNKHI
jgi:UDP-N-acetylmuramate--alanine ligase